MVSFVCTNDAGTHLWKLIADEVISDNDDAVACWAQVLARTSVDDSILADIHWP